MGAQQELRSRFGLRQIGEMKFYLYLSRAKIEMLYQQLPNKKGKSSVEVKADVKFASRTQKVEHELDCDDKLQLVMEALIDAGQVGTVEEPSTYARGMVPMRWGIYDDDGLRPNNTGPLVYFSGLTGPNLVGLGGSSNHIVGF